MLRFSRLQRWHTIAVGPQLRGVYPLSSNVDRIRASSGHHSRARRSGKSSTPVVGSRRIAWTEARISWPASAWSHTWSWVGLRELGAWEWCGMLWSGTVSSFHQVGHVYGFFVICLTPSRHARMDATSKICLGQGFDLFGEGAQSDGSVLSHAVPPFFAATSFQKSITKVLSWPKQGHRFRCPNLT